jgi:hypothetical protein
VINIIKYLPMAMIIGFLNGSAGGSVWLSVGLIFIAQIPMVIVDLMELSK